jgi:protein SCO1
VIARAMLLLLLFLPHAVSAAADLAQFAYRQQPGDQVPLQAVFHDQNGHMLSIGNALGGRPAIVALGYFHCPNLCGVARADLTDALQQSGLSGTADYALLVLSIDPTETPADAKHAAEQDAARLRVQGVPANWYYLTGTPEQIEAVEQRVGFRERFDLTLKQFLHPAGLVFLMPSGTVSSYLLGVGYEPGDIRSGLTRARDGSTANAPIPVLLLCFHYDPATGRYSLAITKVLQLVSALTVATLAGTIVLALRRERRS